jgi:acetyl-CoA C-acetyltransferase
LIKAAPRSDINLLIAPPLKVSDCSQITDGAAAVVLCSKHFIERVQPRGAVRLIGFAHTTDYLR